MNILRQLRWQLTLSYTIVTVSAFLAIILILGGVFLSRVLLPENEIDPELMITDWYSGLDQSNYPILRQLLSQTPVDTVLINLYMKDVYATFTNVPLFHLGGIQFWVSSRASIRVLILGPDGVLLGMSPTADPNFRSQIGLPFNPSQIAGLEGPFRAALAGDTNPKDLYTILVPNQKVVMAGPIFKSGAEMDRPVVGAIVILFDAIPTQKDIPVYILQIAGMSLVIFLLAVGIIGTIFGSFFAHGLADRFKQISITTDRWSSGDFSQYIDDPTGDEITSFSQHLNKMAQQLQNLLRRRQEMAISEERNRLARDLHDSAKQQALAASFQLGTALTLYERDPQDAKKHLVEGDQLVDSVRKELTALVDELRPLPASRQDFSELLGEYMEEWSRHSGIKLNIDIVGNGELSVEIRETLFRIIQEALANIARHSSATKADVSLVYETGMVTLTIQDNGCGFETQAKLPGMGLSSMRARAEGWDGSFTVKSQPGQGTQIRVIIPIAN